MFLTIAIPTFNRATYLEETIDKILAQLPSGLSARIELLISDNGSTDETERVCQSRVATNSGSVRYIQHAENVGFDRNLDSLFLAARGEYVLLVGDDDYPLPDAIGRLWNTLLRGKEFRAALIYCYHELIHGESKMTYKLDEPFFRPSASEKDRFVMYRSGIDLLRERRTALHGGLTGTAFLRKAWLESDRDRFFGTNFLHLAVGYQVAAQYPVCIDRQPTFVIRQFSCHRWPINGELYFGLLKAGRPLLEHYPIDIVREIRRKHDWAVRRAIIIYRALAPHDQQLVKVIRDSLDRVRIGYWIFDRPLLAVSGIVLKLLWHIGQLFQRPEKRGVE
jgi:glycosyltransferase involved in cell wall biosynthesis